MVAGYSCDPGHAHHTDVRRHAVIFGYGEGARRNLGAPGALVPSSSFTDQRRTSEPRRPRKGAESRAEKRLFSVMFSRLGLDGRLSQAEGRHPQRADKQSAHPHPARACAVQQLQRPLHGVLQIRNALHVFIHSSQ